MIADLRNYVSLVCCKILSPYHEERSRLFKRNRATSGYRGGNYSLYQIALTILEQEALLSDLADSGMKIHDDEMEGISKIDLGLFPGGRTSPCSYGKACYHECCKKV